MNSIVARFRDFEDTLDSVTTGAFTGDTIQGLSDADAAELLAVTGRIQRRLEGVQVETVDVVVTRSEGVRDEKMTTKYGCAKPVDLVRMLTGTDTRTATRLVRASRLVHRVQGISDGAFLPARYPALRDAVTDGTLGVTGLLAATDPVEQSARRILVEDRLMVDRELAALAHGADPDMVAGSGAETGEDSAVGSDSGRRPLPLPEDLAVFAKVMVAYLDQDGAAPSEEEALRGRYLRVGPLRDGVHPIRGALLPEVAGQLLLLTDSLLNPRIQPPSDPAAARSVECPADGRSAVSSSGESTTGEPAADGVRFEPIDEHDVAFDNAPDDLTFLDTRTRPQKLHDAFAAILTTAAATDQFPHLGGAAPTLVVTATAEDLTTGTGWATVANTGELVPITAAHHTACAGGIQRVLFDNGRIVSLSTTARIFTALQRRAITARDGGCIIPGCTIPATWCEIHHVTEHTNGGPTHTDNGVLLCWFHHRTLHLTEWTIRTTNGTPEVRGPTWWDPHQHWHHPRNPHHHPRKRQRQNLRL